MAPPLARTAPRVAPLAQLKSDIKRIFEDRANQAAAGEAIGSEQIPKTRRSNAGILKILEILE